MASSSLTSYVDGANFDGMAPDEVVEGASDTGKSGKKDGSKKGPSKTRKKANEVVILSSSFTCWRKVPDTSYQLIRFPCLL